MKKYSIKTIFQLFAVFFKIGLFTFGGGYAMISLIEREAGKRGWANKQDMMELIVLAESTPGVIAVNSATFIGYKVGGFFGALFATIGVVCPSFIIISSLYFCLEAFLANSIVAAAFAGVRACVVVLIVNVFINLVTTANKNIYTYIAFVVSFAVATFTKFNVIYLILISACLGVGYAYFNDKKCLTRASLDSKQDSSCDSQTNKEQDSSCEGQTNKEQDSSCEGQKQTLEQDASQNKDKLGQANSSADKEDK
ncbi:MAG: chromate transporter [Clostridia bacterium]